MLDIQFLLSLLLLGSFVGIIAGLFGVGGGGVIVPVLTSLFVMKGVETSQVVHLALGTSMASIIFTSISSMRAHHAKAGVDWDIVRRMSLGVILGTFLATFIASQINALYLALFFSCYMAFVSLQMFIDKKPKENRQVSGKKEFFFVGSAIGAVSALVSIGGGSMTVPYLVSRNIDIKKAVGCSAAIGLPISIAGTLGYLFNGYSYSTSDSYTLGFIYLPAVFLIAFSSYLTAPLGVKLAHHLPVKTLKKVFSLLLITLSLKMLSTII